MLGYDAAQYAVAARELATRGRLETRFALPIELDRHPSPPWPLALVQPGLVTVEAALLRLAPGGAAASDPAAFAARARRIERLVLLPPAASFLAIALLLAWAGRRMLARHAPHLSPWNAAAAGAAVGIAFALDPEAQHFATGGFTELPFTLGLVACFVALATGAAAGHPFAFGLLMGVTGAFRGNMLWIAPVLALAAAGSAPAAKRGRTFVRAMIGYALPLVPWWIYKTLAFGNPGWDLSALSVWDGVGSRSWFSLNHLPYVPDLPRGGEAVSLLAAKTFRNLRGLGLELLTGPRALWIGALAVAAAGLRLPSGVAATSRATLAVLAVSLVAAAASVPLLRYLFPARVVIEAAGLLVLLAILARAPLGGTGRRALQVAMLILAIGWGGWRSARGAAEARTVAGDRGMPSSDALVDLAVELERRVPAGEPVMSNLGPLLAWYSDRSVVHLALTPDDLAVCRRRLDVRHVLLVFRSPARAWSGWDEVLARPGDAVHRPEWNIARAERGVTRDGYLVLWLDLGALAPDLASHR